MKAEALVLMIYLTEEEVKQIINLVQIQCESFTRDTRFPSINNRRLFRWNNY